MTEKVVCCPYCVLGYEFWPMLQRAGLVCLRTVWPRSDSGRSRFQVPLPQLP
jgi:hypothetical protein